MTTPSDQGGPVLVGVADAAASEPALQYAADEAIRSRRPIRIVHVLTDETAPHADTILHDAAASTRRLTHGQVTVDAVAHAAPLVPALVTLSDAATLVVLQRRRHTRLQSLLDLSVSAHVAGQAHVPTVWVPEDWHRSDSVAPHLVVGVDAADDDETTHLLHHAFERADQHGASLTVVHGWQLSTGYDDAVLDQASVEAWTERYRAALQNQLSVLQVDRPQIPVEVRIVHAPPATALVQAATTADLLMLARGRLTHPLVGHLGSVARAVMKRSTCPVEIIPDAH